MCRRCWFQASEPAALLEFIRVYVEPLERYDDEHNSQLLTSLTTFYDAGFNLHEAARRLDVHVSTLRYRLARVEELLGVDPKVGEARLNIEVALKAANALAVHRSCDAEGSSVGPRAGCAAQQ